MRFDKKWLDTKKARYLKFFAEASYELLSEDVWESYQVYALSTTFKFYELIKICADVTAGKVPKPVIKSMISECNWAFINDPVCEKIFEE